MCIYVESRAPIFFTIVANCSCVKGTNRRIASISVVSIIVRFFYCFLSPSTKAQAAIITTSRHTFLRKGQLSYRLFIGLKAKMGDNSVPVAKAAPIATAEITD